MAWHRSHEPANRLDEIPGVGPALAPPWSPASLIEAFRSAGISRPGSGSYRNSTRAAARTRWAVSANRRPLSAQPVLRRRARVIRYAKIHGTDIGPGSQPLLARTADKVAAKSPWRTRSPNGVGDDAKGERYKEPAA